MRVPDKTDEEMLVAYLEHLPDFIVSVEHEYKWFDTLFDTGNTRDIRGEVASLGHPADYLLTETGVSHQSSIYVDDGDWSLSRAGLSVSVLVRQGWKRSICWLVLKDTVVWEKGRRDAFEIAVRIDPQRVEEALDDWSLMPLTRLERLPTVGGYNFDRMQPTFSAAARPTWSRLTGRR